MKGKHDMAKIFLNIEADSASDLHNVLAAILSGQSAEFDSVVDYSRPVPAPAVEASPAADPVPTADPNEGQADANGEIFDPAIHTGTKNKDGSWRLKKGAVRSEGNPTGATGTETLGSASTEQVGQAADSATGPNAGPADEEDDEFAAFANAAAETNAPAEIPARTWTDTDLAKLCNQAAIKLGSADKIKELIAQYTPEGEVPRSSKVPADEREAFAAAVEQTAGITFAG
jgi:hypothetical protein